MKFAATTFALVLATALGASSAFAADTTTAPAKTTAPKTLTPQQQKMKDCNVQAGDKKGDERKTFMSTCLKGDSSAAPATDAAPATTATPAAAAATSAPATAAASAPVAGSPKSTVSNSQREKMKTCNAQAGQKHLSGADRKTFMSTCLKGDSAAAPAKH